MPYNAQQIPPIDFRPGRAVGVALPFNGPACFKSTYTTGEAIKANLIDYFLNNLQKILKQNKLFLKC